jgi:hypothetical protein
MKLPHSLWLTAAIAMLSLPLLGQTNQQQQQQPPPPTTTTPPPPPPPPPAKPPPPPSAHLFRAGETSLDLFGSLSVGQETIDNISKERVKDDGRLGAGAGINHFFTRHLGLGFDAYTENTQHSLVDNTSGNLIVRIPIDSIHLAPYAYGGAGYQFDPTGLWFGQAGGGLEVRFSRQVGIFIDGRYVFTDGARNVGVGRLGLRLAF